LDCYPSQEAHKGAEAALKERTLLRGQVQQLQLQVEEERGRRQVLRDGAQRKLADAQEEVSYFPAMPDAREYHVSVLLLCMLVFPQWKLRILQQGGVELSTHSPL
jgi:hypothetical protein